MATLIGTSGFGFSDWRGVFYPADMDRADYIRYYSMFFHFVELEFSFYRMPAYWKLESLAGGTPHDFLFSIKAHKALTSGINRGWQNLTAEFKGALKSRAFRSRLAGVVLEFPHRFRYEDQNRMYLGELCAELSEFPLFLAFRNAEWSNESVREEADKRGIGLALTDAADMPIHPNSRLAASADTAYIRFLGRNGTAMGSETAESGLGYSYSDMELAGFADEILMAEESAGMIFAAFGAHAGGSAILDARRLQTRLDTLRPRLAPFPETP